MDFFRTAFASAQEQATKAAAEAKLLAEKAQSAARQQAEEMSKAARHQAEEMSKEASKRFQGLQGDMKRLDLNMVKDSVSKAFAGGNSGGVSPQELIEYGITEEFVNHVKGFTYMTFRDFPEERLTVTRGISPDSMASSVKLGPWQQHHAMLLIQAIPDFNDLRYVLCPGKMPEERFWEIYFVMVKDHLSPKALNFLVMEGAASGSKAVEERAEVAAVDEQSSLGAFTLAHDEDQVEEEEEDGGRYGNEDEDEDEGWEEGALEELIGVEQEEVSGAEASVERTAAASSSAAADEAPRTPTATSSGAKPTVVSPANAWLPSTPGAAISAADVDSIVDTPGTKEDSEEELDDDFDAYVEGMLGGGEAGGEGDGDEEEDDDDDFDDYMNELAKEAGVEGADEEDVTLGSEDLDFGELEDDEEES